MAPVRPSPLLAVLATAAAFGVVDAVASVLPPLPASWSLAWLALVSIPLATLAVAALGPLRSRLAARGPAVLAGALAALILASWLGSGSAANVVKLAAAGVAGMVAAGVLGTARDAAGLAVAIALVDAASVGRGPTRALELHDPGLLVDLTINLHLPGSAMVDHVGASDMLFFACLLAACDRFGLRTRTTWVAMTAALGCSALLAEAWHTTLAALPWMSAAFLVANVEGIRAGRGRCEQRTGGSQAER